MIPLSKKPVKTRNLSLELYYSSIVSWINLVCAYTQNPENKRLIILACMRSIELMPRSVPKIWVDEYKNSVMFHQDHVEYKFNHLTYRKKQYHNNDLFYAVNIKHLIAMATNVFVCWGYDPDFVGMISLYCIDKRIRTFLYEGGWKRISNLYLKTMMMSLEDSHHECLETKTSLLPVEEEKSFLVSPKGMKSYADFFPEEIKGLFVNGKT